MTLEKVGEGKSVGSIECHTKESKVPCCWWGAVKSFEQQNVICVSEGPFSWQGNVEQVLECGDGRKKEGQVRGRY